jgi:hypothetical protein
VPVFQFGIFSETDLTFYAGDDFDFGGRVHTNGNLFLSELTGKTLTFSDKITALKDVVRSHFSNGLSVSTYAFAGTVNIATAFTTPPTYRALKLSPNEGSLTGALGSSANPTWTTISVGTYKNNIRTGKTGAKKLDLPLVSQGAKPIDLIRRPAVNSNEDTVNSPVYNQRLFSKASLRILLSDRPGDILNLPTVTATPPVLLDGDWTATPPNNGLGAYGPVDATHPPAGRSIGPIAATTVAAGSSAAKINVAAVPTVYKLPAGGLKVGALTGVTCTGKTATTFTGCSNVTAAVANNAVVSVVLPSGATAKTTTSAAVASGGTVTIPVVTTAPFMPGLLWVNGTAVSCTGYDTTPAFTGCVGLAAAPTTGWAISTSALAAANTSLLGGYLKVERQNADQTWTDVTIEILNLGIGAPNSDGTICADPTPTAVIRLQRLRDNGGVCNYAGSTNPYDWWSNALYDTREGNFRDVATTGSLTLGGTMHYVALDTNNLRRWFNGTIGTTGTSAVSPNENGYIVYFSDRRGNHNPALPLGAGPAGDETGEYGFEDDVNPASATGTPNGALDSGEDINGNLAFDLYGQTPTAAFLPTLLPLNASDPYSTNGRPWSVVTSAQARVNRPVLFRRALKLINGGITAGVNNLPASGLTVVAENPVYVQGNYNATTDPQAEPNVPAAIMSDAVTLLSNNFSDARSFRLANDASSRPATTTGYRFAVIAGKGLSFTYPAAGTPHFLFGTDGGVGNFLRLLEDWNITGVSINYRGSMVSLYTSRQAVGTFKYGPNVYDFGDRNFSFDTDFLLPALLPPGSQAFRDVNTLTFRQLLRPTQ